MNKQECDAVQAAFRALQIELFKARADATALIGILALKTQESRETCQGYLDLIRTGEPYRIALRQFEAALDLKIQGAEKNRLDELLLALPTPEGVN